jgi:SAM-dependent methyltransferase
MDVRPLLDRRPDLVPDYARERIRESYEHVDSILEHCAGVARGEALDVGSGYGYDSFALAAHFDHVSAIDINSAAVAGAARFAEEAGVANVTFASASTDDYEPSQPADFVLANAMSHLTASRCELLRRLRAASARGAWLYYTEECEAYGPFEIGRAIAARDADELTARVRQVLNGFLGRPHIRFYVAGSAGPVLESLGFEPLHRETQTWGELAVLDRVWARASDVPPAPAGDLDRDYGAHAPEELVDIRPRFADAVDALGKGRRDAVDRVAAQATDGGNRLAPYLAVAAMGGLIPGGLAPQPGLVDRIRRRLGRGRQLPWGELDGLARVFREAAGAPDGGRAG